jgi:hypothetical protein
MKKALLFSAFCFVSYSGFSQGFETIVFAAEDASKLSRDYINPFVKGFMYNMNSGWYTTAKTHNKFGFDITINPSISLVPGSDEYFDFNQSDYQHLSLPNGETSLPTLMSSSNQTTMVNVSIPYGNDTYKVSEFEMPKGIAGDLPLNGVPLPMIQAGVGLPTRTDVKLRFLPTISFGDSGETNLFGLALQHDIGQYLKISKLPLSLAVLGGFTTLNVNYGIEEDEEIPNITVNNGEASFKTTAWTLQALASLDFKIVTIYGGIGYHAGKTDVKLNGDYHLTYNIEDENGNVWGVVEETVTDPIDLRFKVNGMNGTIGTRLNLGFFKIFASYTMQEYNTINGGIAFSFN